MARNSKIPQAKIKEVQRTENKQKQLDERESYNCF